MEPEIATTWEAVVKDVCQYVVLWNYFFTPRIILRLVGVDLGVLCKYCQVFEFKQLRHFLYMKIVILR